MNTFFDEYGNLNIEDLIVNQPSFLKMMEDGIVTEQELKEQSDKVVTLLKDIEKKFDGEQVSKIRELLAEVSVLIAAREFYKDQK